MDRDHVTLSIVVPVYSGEQYLADLVGKIRDLRRQWQEAGVGLELCEAIFALDEPIDDSRSVLQQLSPEWPGLRVIELSRNYGQHSATVAGILYSTGDWVVTLDEDLQHEPARILTLLRKACEQGADVVYAHPRENVHGSGYRDRMSRLAKFLISKLSGNPHITSFNSFRLIRGDVARAASSICAQHTYFDVALTWFTQRIQTVDVEMTDERYITENRSGYRFWTLVQHAKRLILTSDFRILRVTTALSMLLGLSAAIYGAYVLFSHLFTKSPIEVAGWTSLMLVILAFGSVSIFILGLIVEFMQMSMLQLQGRPTFFVVDRSSDPALAEAVARLRAAD